MVTIKQLIKAQYLFLGGEIIFRLYNEPIGNCICFALVLLISGRIFWLANKMDDPSPSIEEIKDKYWDYIQDFCLEILKDEAEALVNTCSIFRDFEKMITDGAFHKNAGKFDFKMSLTLIARRRCIERLQHLRLMSETHNHE